MYGPGGLSGKGIVRDGVYSRPNRQGSKAEIYLVEVPKPERKGYENLDSLKNKVIYWFRTTRHCHSIIRGDIKLVERLSFPGTPKDVIKVSFSHMAIVNGLMSIDSRTIPTANTSITIRYRQPEGIVTPPLHGCWSKGAPYKLW